MSTKYLKKFKEYRVFSLILPFFLPHFKIFRSFCPKICKAERLQSDSASRESGEAAINPTYIFSRKLVEIVTSSLDTEGKR